jgi:hypothetical protein
MDNRGTNVPTYIVLSTLSPGHQPTVTVWRSSTRPPRVTVST